MRAAPAGRRRTGLYLLSPARGGLGGLTAELARAWGGRPALVREDGTVISFRELHHLTDLGACTLIALHDLRKGERVAVPGDPLRGLVALLGVVKAGGVAVPLPQREGGEEDEGPAHHCRARLRWDGFRGLLAEVPGGVFIPYTRKTDELAALAYREADGGWRGTMVNDRSLLAAGIPLALALRSLGVRSARLHLTLDRSTGIAWALACLRAGTALSPLLPSGAWLGKREDLEGAGGTEETRLVCVAGMAEGRAPGSAALCLDGPCLEEACGFFLLRARRGGAFPPRLLWPLPHLRYRVDAETGTLALRGKGLSYGYWGDLEGSTLSRPGGWFQTEMRVRRMGPAFGEA